MAVYRFTGHHVQEEGAPSLFRTATGFFLPLGGRGVNGAAIENLFSRKDEHANLDAVRNQHADVIQHFDAMRDSRIFISNNTEHIARLNEGWSAQTSAGFFERSTQEAKKAISGLWKFVSPAVGVLRQVR